MWWLVKIIKHTTPRWLGTKAAIRYVTGLKPVEMSFKVYPDENTSYEGSPLIVMHGMLGSKENWVSICRSIAEDLIPKRKIYAVDARNHGDSPHSPDHSYEHMADDVAHLLRKENIEISNIMGHSMGGAVMMYFALKYPELVEKAIIIDVSPVRSFAALASMDILYNAMKSVKIPSNVSLSEAKEVVFKHLAKTIKSTKTINFILLNLKEEKPGKVVWSVNIDSLQKNNDIISDFPEEIRKGRKCLKPVLFIGGIKSIFIYTTDIPIIKGIFPAATFKWMNCGHLIHVEQPIEFQEIVVDYLSK